MTKNYGNRTFFIVFSFICMICISVYSTNAEENKVIHSFNLSAIFQQDFLDTQSPFYSVLLSLGETDQDRFLYSLYMVYSLRFVGKGISSYLSLQSMYYGYSNTWDGNISQAWIKVQLFEGWGLTFGRKYLKWQEGYFQNPSDMVNNKLVFGEIGEAAGKDIIELLGLLSINDVTIDMTLVAMYTPGITDIEQVPLYFGIGTILYPFEIKVKAGVRNGFYPQYGWTVKLSLDSLQFYTDWIYSYENMPFSDIAVRDLRLYFKGIAGLSLPLSLTEKTVCDQIIINLEIFYREEGWTKQEGELILQNLGSSTEIAQWTPYEYYRSYVFLSVNFTELFMEHIMLTLVHRQNCEDMSFSDALILKYSPKNLFDISLACYGFFGSKYTESGALHYNSFISLTLSKSF